MQPFKPQMETAMFFITPANKEALLADVAAAVFNAIGVSDREERDSANYPPDEHYFAGYAQNAEVHVFDSDDKRTPEYPFCVSIEDSTWRKGSGVIVTNPRNVAKLLVGAGFRVLVPSEDWHQTHWDGEGEVYVA
jgi:hypothetical protein